MTGRTPYAAEHRIVLKDGAVKWVHERARTFYDEGGNPVRSIGTTQDITERKQADESLRQSEARLREAQAIAQVCELTWQLKGQATGRQVEGAKVGITANQGLFGHGSAVLLTK